MSRRLSKLKARIRVLEAPAKEQAQKRISERLVEYERLRAELVPVDVYKNGLVQRIEYEARDDLEAADRQSKKTA
jgi:hypothetical protein